MARTDLTPNSKPDAYPDLPVVAVATASPVYDKMLSNIQEVKARDGYVVAIASAGDTQIASLADDVITVPRVDPMLDPLVSSVPLQLLAYHVADLLGTDIDQPRNLCARRWANSHDLRRRRSRSDRYVQHR